MKAIVYQNFGSADILRFEEIDKPTPADNKVLIRVRAASVNPLDWKLMKGGPLLLRVLLGLGKSKIKRPGAGWLPCTFRISPLTAFLVAIGKCKTVKPRVHDRHQPSSDEPPATTWSS